MKFNLKTTKLLLFSLMLLVLALPVLGATAVTTPADNAELAIGTTYEFTGSTALAGEYNCSWYYKQRAESAYTLLSTSVLVNSTDANYTVPVSYGTNSFNLTCVNSTGTVESDATTDSIGLHYYDSGEISEVVVDFIMEFWKQLVAFAGLIALVVLGLWARQKFK